MDRNTENTQEVVPPTTMGGRGSPLQTNGQETHESVKNTKMDDYKINIDDNGHNPTKRSPEIELPTTFNGQEPHEHVITFTSSSSSSSNSSNNSGSSSSIRLGDDVPTHTDPPMPPVDDNINVKPFTQFGMWVTGIAFAVLFALFVSNFGEEKGRRHVLFISCVSVLLIVLILGIGILVLAYGSFTNCLDGATKLKILSRLRIIVLGIISLFAVVTFALFLRLKKRTD